MTSKDRGNNLAIRNKFNIQKENNYIVKQALHEIFLQEINQVSSEEELDEILNMILIKMIYIRLTI